MDPPPPPGSGMLILGIRTTLPTTANPTLSGGPRETLEGLNGLSVVVTRIDVVHRTVASDARTERVITVDTTEHVLRLSGDLRDLSTRMLGFFLVPAGFIMQIRAVVSSAAIDIRGTTEPVRTPSGEQSGLKIDPLDGVPFEIRSGEQTAARVVLEPFEQLIRNHGQGFLLHPEMSAEHTTVIDLSPILLDRIVVRFRNLIPRSHIDAVNASIGTTVMAVHEPTNYYVLRLPVSATLDQALEFYGARLHVLYAVPDTLVVPWTEPCNPSYTMDTDPWRRIGAPAAWGTTTGNRGSRSALLAIVEPGGFDLASPSFARNIAIRQAELPPSIFDRDRNGGNSTTGPEGDAFVGGGVLVDQHDIDRFDVNRDGVIAIDDLEVFQSSRTYPCNVTTAHPFGCDLDNDGRITALDLVRQGNVPDDGLFEDRIDEAGNPCTGQQFCDDVVGWNFAEGSNRPMEDPAPRSNTHASAMAAVVGGIGVADSVPMCTARAPLAAGLNWSARIVPIQLGSSRHTGSTPTPDNIAPATRAGAYIAFQYAAQIGAHVINASFGSIFTRNAGTGGLGAMTSGDDGDIPGVGSKWPGLMRALEFEAQDLGFYLSRTVLVAGSGNNARRLTSDHAEFFVWPTQLDLGNRIVRVTKVLDDGTANAIGASGPDVLDIAAPSGPMPTLSGMGTLDLNNSGSSISAALVTGAIGLAVAANPTLLDGIEVAARLRAVALCGTRGEMALEGVVAGGRSLRVNQIVSIGCR